MAKEGDGTVGAVVFAGRAGASFWPDPGRLSNAELARRGGVDELQQEAVHQLRLATNPAELMTVHAALLMAGWQHSIQCSTDIANAWFAIGAAGALPPRKPGLN